MILHRMDLPPRAAQWRGRLLPALTLLTALSLSLLGGCRNTPRRGGPENAQAAGTSSRPRFVDTLLGPGDFDDRTPRIASAPGEDAFPSAEDDVRPARPASAAPRLRPGVALDVKLIVAGRVEVEKGGLVVSDSGLIDLPLLRKVDVDGLTIEELTAVLARAYSRFYIAPEVIASFSRQDTAATVSPWGYVTVVGRVNDPGRIPIPSSRDLTVSKAVLEAGGLDSSAQDKSVRVTRQGYCRKIRLDSF